MSELPLRLLWDARRAGRGDAEAILERRRERFERIVAFARAASPYYAELYRGLPDRIEGPDSLPVTTKAELMARFDQWSTDRAIRLDEVRDFLGRPELVGRRFLDRYLVATSSGTTGSRGIVILDRESTAVNNAIRLRALSRWLGATQLGRVLARRLRVASIVATGGHFGGVGLLRDGGWRRSLVRVLPVYATEAELVAELNDFRPAILTGYASAIAKMASEQERGRLRIDPVFVALAAEGLPIAEQRRISAAFGAVVAETYAAVECPFIAHSCAHGWLHVNADWVLLEPVDADNRPVSPGVESEDVLLTNLVNRVQPVIRYALGDRVLERPDPCPCGSPLPAIRVRGRAADRLSFASNGTHVELPPLAVGGVLDAKLEIERFQIVQTGPERLRLRLQFSPDADPDRAWSEVAAAIEELLVARGLGHVALERADEAPQQSEGGKYRKVIPLPG